MDPRFEQWLGTALGIVGLVLALIGFAGPLPSHTPLALALICGGAVGAAVGGLIIVRVRSRPPFSLRQQHLEFEITKPDGSQCVCRKTIKFRCNLRDQTEYVHRNIYADGPVTNFAWDGEGKMAAAVKSAGEWVVAIHRQPCWPVGRDHTGTLSYTVADTFRDNTEWIAYVCDRDTESAEMIIRFPATRPFKRAWTTDRKAGQVTHVERDGALRQSSFELRREIQNPKIGVEYYIYWEW
jgi:hypothetical protein